MCENLHWSCHIHLKTALSSVCIPADAIWNWTNALLCFISAWAFICAGCYLSTERKMGSVVTFILLRMSSLSISAVEILYCKCLEQQKMRCRVTFLQWCSEWDVYTHESTKTSVSSWTYMCCFWNIWIDFCSLLENTAEHIISSSGS